MCGSMLLKVIQAALFFTVALDSGNSMSYSATLKVCILSRDRGRSRSATNSCHGDTNFWTIAELDSQVKKGVLEEGARVELVPQVFSHSDRIYPSRSFKVTHLLQMTSGHFLRVPKSLLLLANCVFRR